MSMTLRDMSGTSGVVAVTLTIIGSAAALGALLSHHEHRSDAALARLAAEMAGVAGRLEVKLEERMAGVIKEVDAKVAGSAKEVDAKVAGAKETITKEVDAKLAGFEKVRRRSQLGDVFSSHIDFSPTYPCFFFARRSASEPAYSTSCCAQVFFRFFGSCDNQSFFAASVWLRCSKLLDSAVAKGDRRLG